MNTIQQNQNNNHNISLPAWSNADIQKCLDDNAQYIEEWTKLSDKNGELSFTFLS
jgi:hypothetical protein